MTDYTDPSTIDVDEVMANIDNAYRMRGNTWTQRPFWPNVTVLALTNEVRRLREFVAAHDALQDLISDYTDDRVAYNAAVVRLGKAREALA